MKRTIIYIDGFNLYYGSLKNSPYKWLDLKVLFSKLLDSSHEITAIKYFTARISERKDNHGSLNRQNIYLRALDSYIPEIDIYYGHYLTHSVVLPLAKNHKEKPEFVRVLKSEEKGLQLK